MQLYTRYHLAVRHAVGRADKSKPDWWTRGVHFAADGSTWATNGYLLLRFAGPAPEAKDYPVVDGLDPSDAALSPFTLPLDLVEAVRKAIPKDKAMPILNVAALATAELPTRATFATTDLTGRQLFSATEQDLLDPNLKRWEYGMKMLAKARDTKPTAADVCVDAKLLALVVKAVEEARPKSTKTAAPVVWRAGETELDAVYLRSEHPDAGTLEALVMPMRQ